MERRVRASQHANPAAGVALAEGGARGVGTGGPRVQVRRTEHGRRGSAYQAGSRGEPPTQAGER